MAGLHEKLLVLFPDYKRGDWELYDDGTGTQKIIKWNRNEAQPNINTINAVSDNTAITKFKEVMADKTIVDDPVIGALLRVISRATGQNQVNVLLMMVEELSK